MDYTNDGFLTITDYHNNPLPHRKYYLMNTKILTVDDLNLAILKSKFIITEIDIDRLQADYP